MDIRLKRLSLHQFKGFTFTLDADCADLSILGQNGTGKTTISDAWHWLLFGKDSLNRADFEIKTLTPDGEALHGLEHSVEAIIVVDGREITLKKSFGEIWTKKRGSAQAVFTGHSSSFWINGVPCQLKDYKDQISEIVGDESIFRLLTSPSAFPALPWQKQRELLLTICGDLTDAEVIQSDSKLAPLVEILTNRSLEDHKKIIAARRAEINKQLTALPIRIDEVKRGMPDVAGLDRKAVIKEVGVLETEIGIVKLRLQGIDNGGGIAELSKKIQDIKYQISQLENAYYLEGMKHVTQLNAKINELTAGRQGKATQIHNVKFGIEQNQRRTFGLEEQLQSLREKWTAIDAESFQAAVADTCPACGQALPSDRVQDARDKALAQFNQDKAERMLAVEMRGKELRGELDITIPIIERLHAELLGLETVAADDQHDILVAERDILKARAEDYSQVPGRPELLEQKAGLEKEMEEIRNGLSQNKYVIQKEIDDLTAQLAEAKEKADRFTRQEQGAARIEELKAEEKKLAAEFEKLEGELYLAESFIKTKVEMLTERINGKFELARFRLFDIQVNQGLAETCEIMVNGVGYNSGLNSASRIQGGCDIISTLQDHFKLHVPTWLDNREGCTMIPQMKCQVISLYVSPNDSQLRVEPTKRELVLKRMVV
jgi:DNA repair exonuclease SbcCD ATPase subunit